MKQRRQYFKCKYHFISKSGKEYGWTKRDILALSKIGAEDTIRWLYSSRHVVIDYARPTFNYVGEPIYPCTQVIGDY